MLVGLVGCRWESVGVAQQHRDGQVRQVSPAEIERWAAVPRGRAWGRAWGRARKGRARKGRAWGSAWGRARKVQGGHGPGGAGRVGWARLGLAVMMVHLPLPPRGWLCSTGLVRTAQGKETWTGK